VLAPLQAEGWWLRHSLPWQGRGDIDSVAVSPTGIAVAIETKTRSYERRHLVRVREQVAWLSRRRRRWARDGALGVLCLVRVRGVERVVDADTDTFTVETAASVPVVVDFWAAWCGPCRMISPVLEDLARRHAGHLKVLKVDVDANPGLATRFGAQSIPLLVVIRDGRQVDGVVGALPRAALEQRLGPVLVH
jgi:thioredoxin 2